MFNSIKLLAISFLLAVTCFVKTTHASEQTIATIGRDDSDTTYKLIINTDEDGRTITSFYKDIYHGETKSSRDILDLHVLMNAGIVLEQRNQYIVLKLKSDNFDEEQGGTISIDTLYNALNGKRKSYEVSLAKDELGWTLLNQGKAISKLFIQSNKVMLAGIVGIKNLQMK
jgi:hypothetical protein